MKLVSQLFFILSYPWYLVHTLMLRVSVIVEHGDLQDTDKEQIAIALQERWYAKPLLEQLLYSVTCSLIYTCLYFKITAL
jgi:hypothetical protein